MSARDVVAATCGACSVLRISVGGTLMAVHGVPGVYCPIHAEWVSTASAEDITGLLRDIGPAMFVFSASVTR